MWFVRAKRNKKQVLLPAYGGKSEADAMKKSLDGFGWQTKLVDVRPQTHHE